MGSLLSKHRRAATTKEKLTTTNVTVSNGYTSDALDNNLPADEANSEQLLTSSVSMPGSLALQCTYSICSLSACSVVRLSTDNGTHSLGHAIP